MKSGVGFVGGDGGKAFLAWPINCLLAMQCVTLKKFHKLCKEL